MSRRYDRLRAQRGYDVCGRASGFQAPSAVAVTPNQRYSRRCSPLRGPLRMTHKGRNPMMPRLGSMRQFPTVKRTDVQFSNEMSNACPIGHARETDSVVVSEGSQIARVMFSFELSYRWHKRRQFEAQSCRDRLSAGGRVGPFVVRRGADERRAGGYRGRRSGALRRAGRCRASLPRCSTRAGSGGNSGSSR